jgi:hypothetical protein
MGRPTKAQFIAGLDELAARQQVARIHPDASEPTARAVLEALAGLPHYEALYAGEVGSYVVVLTLASGERVTGDEMARRSQLLFERAKVLAERRNAPVAVLQLAVYERPVPEAEASYVVAHGRKVPLVSRKAQVGTWIVSLSEPAVHARNLRGWPAELSADVLRALASATPAPAAAV